MKEWQQGLMVFVRKQLGAHVLACPGGLLRPALSTGSVHSRSIASDTMFATTGLFYSAATSTRLTLGGLQATPSSLALGVLALVQWVLVMMLFGSLIRR